MSFARTTLLLLLPFIWQTVQGNGCVPTICEGNFDNSLRHCPDFDGTCGAYFGKRFDQRFVKGVDIVCQPDSKIYAPFDGTLSYQRPFGDNSCVDHGLKITGVGQWIGYTAVISFVQPAFFGGQVRVGEEIGKSLSLSCLPRQDSPFDPHILFQFFRQGKAIDPTYHLKHCMCTGQLCESNIGNEMTDVVYANKAGVGKGWEIKCANVEYTMKGGEKHYRQPNIYSPIEGHFLGRFRPQSLNNGVENYVCSNDGIFILGAGHWTDFTAHIYNAKFTIELGAQTIRQGQLIGKRLKCLDDEGDQSDNIFVELRYKGKFRNFTNMILGTDCKLPDFY